MYVVCCMLYVCMYVCIYIYIYIYISHIIYKALPVADRVVAIADKEARQPASGDPHHICVLITNVPARAYG